MGNRVANPILQEGRTKIQITTGAQYHVPSAQSTAFESAKANLLAAADEVGIGVNPEPGDVLLLTNNPAVHARFPLEPPIVPPPADRMLVRWNKLIWMAHVKDNAAITAASRKGRRWIVEKRLMFNFDRIVALADETAAKDPAFAPRAAKARKDRDE